MNPNYGLIIGTSRWYMIVLGVALALSLSFSIICTIFCHKEDIANKHYDGITIENWFENFYYGIVTLFGIGFGNIHPISFKGRLITTIYVIMSSLILWSFF